MIDALTPRRNDPITTVPGPEKCQSYGGVHVHGLFGLLDSEHLSRLVAPLHFRTCPKTLMVYRPLPL